MPPENAKFNSANSHVRQPVTCSLCSRKGKRTCQNIGTAVIWFNWKVLSSRTRCCTQFQILRLLQDREEDPSCWKIVPGLVRGWFTGTYEGWLHHCELYTNLRISEIMNIVPIKKFTDSQISKLQDSLIFSITNSKIPGTTNSRIPKITYSQINRFPKLQIPRISKFPYS